MMESAVEKSFPFDLGSAFANLCRYLTTAEKARVASTCRLMRQVLMRGDIWQRFEVSDLEMGKKWEEYVGWAEKYLRVIKPSELVVVLVEKEHAEDNRLLRALLEPKQQVDTLSIRSDNQLVHLALANACPNTVRLALHSKEASDELVQCMFKHMPRVTQLEISADTLSFTLARASQYITHPLQKLILKPYSIDYSELLKLVVHEEVNRLDELEIDVEQCEQELLVEIVSGLRHISRLRLYHMERFDRQDYAKLLADRLSPEMKELALTKCYHLDMTVLAERLACPTLLSLDLTEATRLIDDSVELLASRCCQLRQINLSWCNELTDRSISKIVQRCPALERVVLNGIKSLTDAVFKEYQQFKPLFREKVYDEVKYEFRKECKHAKEEEMGGINGRFAERTTLEKLFDPTFAPFPRMQTLSNLRYLECNSCNSISDKVLKIIHCFNRTAQVYNYYGEDVSLFRNSFEEEFID